MFTITDQLTVPGTGYFLEDWKVVTQEFRLSDDKELPYMVGSVDSSGNFTLESPDIYQRRIKVFAEQPFGITWEPDMPVAAGDYIRSTVSDKYVYKAENTGTTGLSEPSWNATHEATTTDNDITFVAVAYLGKGENNGKIWQGEYEGAAGDEGFLAHNHSNMLLSYPFNDTGRSADNAPIPLRMEMAGAASALSGFTFAFKIVPNNPSDGSVSEGIFSWGSHNGAFWWDHISAPFQCAAAIQDSGGTWYQAQIPIPPSAGEEHTIVVTYDGSDLKIYLNKILEDTNTINITPNLTHNNLILGAWGDIGSTSKGFSGVIKKFVAQDIVWDQTKIDDFFAYG